MNITKDQQEIGVRLLWIKAAWEKLYEKDKSQCRVYGKRSRSLKKDLSTELVGDLMGKLTELENSFEYEEIPEGDTLWLFSEFQKRADDLRGTLQDIWGVRQDERRDHLLKAVAPGLI